MPAGVLDSRETGVFRFIPDPDALLRSHAAVYELLGYAQATSGVGSQGEVSIPRVRRAAPAAVPASKP